LWPSLEKVLEVLIHPLLGVTCFLHKGYGDHQTPKSLSHMAWGPFSLQSPHFWWLMTTQPKQANMMNILMKMCNLLAMMHECPLKVRLRT
jgi:hypothetical protein